MRHTRGTSPLPFIPILLSALVAALLVGCATGESIAPPGGPRDTIPPQIVSTSPTQGEVNVDEPTIEITFDEYLRETGIGDAIVITPVPRTPPSFSWSGRTLEIELQEPLRENRTYTVTVGSGLSDETGNRLGTPFTLRFATGPTIDSGRIQGEVVGKADASAFVFAWRLEEHSGGGDLRVDSLLPDFVAPVADNGSFSLEGLTAGTYRLLAVVDRFGDGRFSPAEDPYGLPGGDVTLSSQEEPATGVRIRLRSGPDDRTPPALYSARSIDQTRTELRFSEVIDTAGLGVGGFALRAAGTSLQPTSVLRSPASGLTLLLRHSPLPAEVEASVRATGVRDTAGNVIEDTSASATFTVAGALDTLPPTLLPMTLDTLRPYTFPDSIAIAFDEEVTLTDGDAAVTMRDTAGRLIRFRLTRRSPALFDARPLDTLFSGTGATLAIDLRRFRDPSGRFVDSIARIPIRVAPLRQLGSIEGTIVDSAQPSARHVLRLRERTTGQTVTRTGLQAGPWSIDALPEGEYELVAWRDVDGDGEYDYGRPVPWEPAEAFVAWSGTVRVRPRWTTNKVDLIFTAGDR